MFWNRHKIKMEDLKMLRTTSKKSLIDSALVMAKGDTQKAKEIIELYSSYMELPDFDPIQPNTLSQIKDTAGQIFGWVKENKDDIYSAIDFIRNMRGNKRGGNIPPINSTQNPLPKI